MSIRGERLSQEMAPEVQKLIYEPRLQREINYALDYMHAVNQAHLLMLVKTKLVGRDAARIVAKGMLELEELGAAGLANNPALEDLYFNWEAAFVARFGIETGGSLHIGRSRNDISATIDRMRAREQTLCLVGIVNDVITSLLDQASRYADTVMPGYTHLQPSQPVSFGFYLLGVATALGRDIGRLLVEYGRMNFSPLGAGAMAGTSFPIDRSETATLLGFAGVTEHSQDAVAARDYMISLCAVCTSLSTTWSRLAQDFYVWTTSEFGMIDFADSVAGVSSIMPQKKNPVVIEVLKANAGEVIGDFTAMLATMRTSHFSHSIDATRSSLNRAWSMLETCQSSCTLLKLLINSVIPREARMKSLASTNFSTMTDLADFMVQRYGFSFREAHHVVGRVVRNAMDQDMKADEITGPMIQDAAEQLSGQSIAIASLELKSILDPVQSIARRISSGSPAPAAVHGMIAHEREILARHRATSKRASTDLLSTKKALKNSMHELASIRLISCANKHNSTTSG